MSHESCDEQVPDRTALDALVFIRNIATAKTAAEAADYAMTAEHMTAGAQAFLEDHGLST